ncbi:probable G-protein coupled receptor frpr-1 [Pomacea canaliculata]|uniref:probable G-protein coupled receptor frpr-1 n=1 Tax=Pomacea canaliculata TaxID=400727 RepID=UPI000D728211|nr:probable G-protein coupled receptor frpr-1 [Pomacea canaliculata]
MAASAENVITAHTTSSSPHIIFDGSDVPHNCVTSSSVLWQRPDDPISAATEEVVQRVKTTVVAQLCFLIGGASNCVNMAVFLKQGVHERNNMCLFTLALVDLLYLLFICFLYGENTFAFFGQVPRIGPVHAFVVTNHLLGLYGLAWTSAFLSAVIAAERCFCILNPLHSKTFLRTSTLAFFVAISCVVIIAGFFVVSEKWTTVCMYNPENNSSFTLLTTNGYYRRNRKIVDIFDGLIYGLLLPGVDNLAVAFSTGVMAVHLKRAVSWRDKASSGVSTKELLLTKMLVCLSIQYNLSSVPNFVFRITCMFVEDLSENGGYRNTYFLMRSIIEMVSILNPSLHFFVYISFGSRYRKTLKHLCALRHWKNR